MPSPLRRSHRNLESTPKKRSKSVEPKANTKTPDIKRTMTPDVNTPDEFDSILDSPVVKIPRSVKKRRGLKLFQEEMEVKHEETHDETPHEPADDSIMIEIEKELAAKTLLTAETIIAPIKKALATPVAVGSPLRNGALRYIRLLIS